MILNELIRPWSVILASASPRRQELLRGLGIDFEVDTQSKTDEQYDPSMPKARVPEFLSQLKSNGFHRPLQAHELLITADTLVCVEDEILGKPSDRNEAVRMLQTLSGRTHQVFTGVTLRTCNRTHSFCVQSDVVFREITLDEIDYYIDTYKPYDKAGSYGIQEWIGYAAITGLHGSYFNVMGLPVQRLYDELVRFLSEQPE